MKTKTNSPEVEFALSSVRSPVKEEEELPEIAKEYSKKRADIIPPVGIADPELVTSFLENMENEEKILQDVKQLEEYHQENKAQTAKREGLSLGARFLEGLGGTVGALLNSLSGEAYFDDNGELLKEGEAQFAPSSSDLRNFTKTKTGKYLEPKNEASKNFQELSTDIGGSSIIPGLGVVAKLIVPMAGQSIKALAKHQGATETQADLAKLGVMTVATLANIGNAPQFARRAYNQAINMVPQGTRISASPSINALRTLRDRPWFKTGRTTSKGPAMDEIQRIENSIQGGMIDAHEAMQIRRDINEARKKLGAFNYEPGIDKAQARRFLDEADETLVESLNQYGRTQNPEWLAQYNRANEAYRVTGASRQLQDFIASHPMAKPLQSQMAKTLFYLGGTSAISHVPALLTAAAPLAATAKSIQIMNRMIRSPALRNYYLKVLSSASAANAPAMEKALQRFDEEAAKLEKKSQ